MALSDKWPRGAALAIVSLKAAGYGTGTASELACLHASTRCLPALGRSLAATEQGCLGLMFLLAIAQLAPPGDSAAVTTALAYLLSHATVARRAALTALKQLRAAEFTATTTVLVTLCGCRNIDDELFEHLCEFFADVPDAIKSAVVAEVKTLMGHSRPAARKLGHRLFARLCQQGHGERKLTAAPAPQPKAALPQGLRAERNLAFDTAIYDLRGEVRGLLDHFGPRMGFGKFADAEAELEAFQAKENVFSDFRYEKKWRECVRNSPAFLATYERLVQEVIGPYIKSQLADGPRVFHYQYPPTLRLQPGPSNRARRVHRDAEYGHQEGEVNFWMPLTDYDRTKSTLWVESVPNHGDFHPLEINYGSITMFHGSLCRHSVPPNPTDWTRISIDFRIGVDEFFDEAWTLKGVDHTHNRRTFRCD